MKNLISDLQNLGFSEKEASIYIAALECGTAGAHTIGRRAKINRGTTYSILEILIKKGLITQILQSGDKRYRAETPQRILTLLHLQQKEIEQKRKLADDLVMRLQVFHNVSSDKPVIKYYESIDGLRTMQQEYELLEGDIIQIVGLSTLQKITGAGTNENHIKAINEKGRRIRTIAVSDNPDCLTGVEAELVIVPTDLIDIKGEMTVCGDRLVLFSYSAGLIAIEIQSKTIADTARAVLELAWQRALDWKNKQAEI